MGVISLLFHSRTNQGSWGGDLAKILVMASTFPRWERDTAPPFVYHLSEGLAGRGHDIHVLAPHTRGAALEERLGSLQVHRFRYSLESWESLCYDGGILQNLRRQRARWGLVPFFLGAEVAAMSRLVRKHNIDLVHAHWFLPQGLAAALGIRWTGVPLVVTGHGGDIFATRSRSRQAAARFAARKARQCTVNSSVMAEELRRLTGVAATIIPMGVDVARFPYLPPASRRPSGCRQQGLRILFVGRMVEKKGARYLIEALPQVCDAIPQATLTLVGDGPERPALEKLVQQLGLGPRVQFTGSIPNEELRDYYAQADVFVAPSIKDREGDTEALGVVILEAAASGTPIVATNVGGIPDIVINGQTGLLAGPANPGALAEGILRLHNDPVLAGKLAAGARGTVESRFSWDSVVDRFDTLFRQLLEQQAENLASPRRSWERGPG